jgi:hypothetical protein
MSRAKLTVRNVSAIHYIICNNITITSNIANNNTNALFSDIPFYNYDGKTQAEFSPLEI